MQSVSESERASFERYINLGTFEKLIYRQHIEAQIQSFPSQIRSITAFRKFLAEFKKTEDFANMNKALIKIRHKHDFSSYHIKIMNDSEAKNYLNGTAYQLITFKNNNFTPEQHQNNVAYEEPMSEPDRAESIYEEPLREDIADSLDSFDQDFEEKYNEVKGTMKNSDEEELKKYDKQRTKRK